MAADHHRQLLLIIKSHKYFAYQLQFFCLGCAMYSVPGSEENGQEHFLKVRFMLCRHCWSEDRRELKAKGEQEENQKRTRGKLEENPEEKQLTVVRNCFIPATYQQQLPRPLLVSSSARHLVRLAVPTKQFGRNSLPVNTRKIAIGQYA